MRSLALLFLLTALISGCSGQSVKTFNEQGFNEKDLATVSTREEGGLFGTFMAFKSVDGQEVRGYFDKKVETVKVTPGKHTYQIKFHDQSFSLFESDQKLQITFEFDAVAGHEYVIHVDMDKTVAQRFTFGGDLSGWIEDTTTGEKLKMNQPGVDLK